MQENFKFMLILGSEFKEVPENLFDREPVWKKNRFEKMTGLKRNRSEKRTGLTGPV